MNKPLMLLAVTGMLATGCGAKQEEYPNTGSAVYEKMMGSMTSVDELVLGQNYYTTAALAVRNESGARLGLLSRHDKVTVVSFDGISGKSGYVQITFRKKSYHNILDSEKFFVSLKYLSESIEDYRDFKGKYFVIQNLATERLRVYENICNAQKVCNHKMVMETEMAVGENTKETRSIVGSFRITDWWKFYQDHAGHYPSWYRDSYPEPPKAGSGFLKWFKSRYMPVIGDDRKGDMRGAFGWYTAWVGPNHHSQWTHGTIGWGSDKDKLIKATKKFSINLIANPRSSGCSRLNNEAIAYLRELLPVGTPIIKVYAKEALLDKNRSKYTFEHDSWDYILTKNNAYSTTNFSADKSSVLSRGVGKDRWIEEGTFSVDNYPTMYNFTPGEDLSSREAKTSTSGNVYRVDEDKMKGIYYVDAGLLENYSHPKTEEIVKGGFRNELAPDYVILTEGNDKSEATYTRPEGDNDDEEVYIVTQEVNGAGAAVVERGDKQYASDMKNAFVTGENLERDSEINIRVQVSSGSIAKFSLVAVDEDDWKLVMSEETSKSSDKLIKSFIKRYFKNKKEVAVRVRVNSSSVEIKKSAGRNVEFIYKI
ncbi:L,D-transpeptidase [Halobacteriovorax sp. HLS]|uniref:L,D-transpeptidase n=1 Tax=Halobacteriovorax sp. HLS TaxID=2234000 RepID=UPI000FDC49EB|nr:L,D-transpeptidase [Halobacteriovorax sp. HLS]